MIKGSQDAGVAWHMMAVRPAKVRTTACHQLPKHPMGATAHCKVDFFLHADASQWHCRAFGQWVGTQPSHIRGHSSALGYRAAMVASQWCSSGCLAATGTATFRHCTAEPWAWLSSWSPLGTLAWV
ncbi:hypothetical protein P7K49_039664 [Saguinus oedipus]|uniref:Uncharacterized protein n=1 Tax=Saguinus oedipus TaxID=9490 RepID=A0ABQ9TBH9_SAGOE|nr:hypothetical protein P7K49_039664 [Saguinus oedipus]